MEQVASPEDKVSLHDVPLKEMDAILADMESHEGVGRDIHFCKGRGQILYLIVVINVVFLESEFEANVMYNGVSL